MNNTHDRPPRFLCRLIRWGSAFHARLGVRHAVACEDCRKHTAAVDALEQRLRRDARQRTASLPEGIEPRLAQAVTRALREPEPAPRRTSFWPLLSLAGVAAAAAVIVAVALLRPPGGVPQITENTPANPAGSEIAGVPAPAAGDDAVPVGGIWGNLSTLVAEQNPLQRELDSVYSDTRAALRFLALNFLPATTGRLTAEEQPPSPG